MNDETPDPVLPDAQAEEMILDYVALCEQPTTLLGVIKALAARHKRQEYKRPTHLQVIDGVSRLITQGRLIDMHDPAVPESKHFLRIPRPKGVNGV